MLGIIIAIFSALFLAFSQITLKKCFKELNPSVAFFFDSLFGLLIWIPIGLLFGGSFTDLPQTIGYAIVGAILSEALVFYALSKGNLSITSTLMATYPIFTLIFSMLINKETITPFQIALIIIIVIGLVFTCFEKNSSKAKIKKMAIIVPLFTAFAIGFADTISKTCIDNTSAFSFLIAIALAQVPISIIYLIITKQDIGSEIKIISSNIKLYKNAILGSIFNILGTGLLYISFNYTFASIVSPITASHSALVVIYSIFIFKEKISIQNKIGVGIALLGVIVLSIFV